MNGRAPSTTKEPDALVDLKGKLEEEKTRHAHMIAVNKYFREALERAGRERRGHGNLAEARCCSGSAVEAA